MIFCRFHFNTSLICQYFYCLIACRNDKVLLGTNFCPLFLLVQNFPIAEHIAEKKIQGSGPRLSLKGAPDDVIDLDDVNPNMPRTPGVKSLIERFMKHSASKKKGQKAQTVELKYET